MNGTERIEERWNRIRIELCCSAKCPAADCGKALQELQAALKELGLKPEITLTLFASEKEAMAREMVGSPTLCIDDKDLFYDFSVDEVGVRCRIYADRGEVASYPTRQMIRKALLRHLILRAFGRKR